MRVWLFAPGHEERKVGKALASLEAEGSARPDLVILDWEDAVPAAEKAAARDVTIGRLEALDASTRHKVVVRVNHLESDWFAEDHERLQGEFLGAVMLPKVERKDQIDAVVDLDLPIAILLESALGVQLAFELCAAHPQVRYAAFGPLDLLADLGGEWTPESEETLYARQRVAIAARAARLASALDGPYPRLHDLEGLLEDSRRGRRMGYGGRMVIHPAQVPVVHEAFAPTEDELDFARRVMKAARAGEAEGRGAVSVDGRFVDPPVIRWAESVLARIVSPT